MNERMSEYQGIDVRGKHDLILHFILAAAVLQVLRVDPSAILLSEVLEV